MLLLKAFKRALKMQKVGTSLTPSGIMIKIGLHNILC